MEWLTHYEVKCKLPIMTYHIHSHAWLYSFCWIHPAIFGTLFSMMHYSRRCSEYWAVKIYAGNREILRTLPGIREGSRRAFNRFDRFWTLNRRRSALRGWFEEFRSLENCRIPTSGNFRPFFPKPKKYAILLRQPVCSCWLWQKPQPQQVVAHAVRNTAAV